MKKKRLFTALLLLGMLAGSGGSEEAPAIRCYRKDDGFKLDGRLDDAAWKNKLAVKTFFKSKEMGPAKYQTEVLLMWDAEFLYCGAVMRDEDIVGHYPNRDDPLYKEDAFEIFIRPDARNNFIFEFEFSPAGIIWDGRNRRTLNPYKSEGDPKAWNAPGILCAVCVDGTLNDRQDKDRSWSVEIMIPFKAFAGAIKVPPSAGDCWPMIFARCESAVFLDKAEWSASIPISQYGFWENYGEWRGVYFAPERPEKE